MQLLVQAICILIHLNQREIVCGTDTMPLTTARMAITPYCMSGACFTKSIQHHQQLF